MVTDIENERTSMFVKMAELSIFSHILRWLLLLVLR